MKRRGLSIVELITVLAVLIFVAFVLFSKADTTVKQNITCDSCITKQLENRDKVINNQVK